MPSRYDTHGRLSKTRLFGGTIFWASHLKPGLGYSREMLEIDQNNGDLISRLRSLDLWTGDIDVQPLPGGLTNTNLIVTDNVRTFVVRFGKDIEIHAIFQANVRTAMTAAAAASISPEVVFADGDMIVMEYLSGGTLKAENFKSPAVREEAVGLIKRIRGIGTHLPGAVLYSCPFQRIERYCTFLQQSGHTSGHRLVLIKQIAQRLEGIAGPFLPVFSHSDLLPQNFVRDANGALKVIDWDYSGIGHPLLDLASLVVSTDLDPSEWDRLLALLLDGQPSELDHKTLSVLAAAFSLVDHLWADVQARVSPLSVGQVAASMSSTYEDRNPSFEGYSEMNLSRFFALTNAHTSNYKDAELNLLSQKLAEDVSRISSGVDQ